MGHEHLSQDERYQIFSLLEQKFSIRHIAKKLGRSPGTISRELHRNGELGTYDPCKAQQMASDRAQESREGNVRRIPQDHINCALSLLRCQWSPDQISKWLAKKHGIRISHETIYQYILKDKRLGGTLFLNLRRRHRKYNRRQGKENRRGVIKNRRSIDTRPTCVETRAHIGHWEGDTVIGTQRRGKVLVTLAERKSRYLVGGFAKSKSAKDVNETIIALMKSHSALIKTLTVDNGKEFASHEELADELSCDVFFAHPYSSWERATNENTNGLIRQYLPKGQSFANVTDEQLQKFIALINNRPRAVLGYQTPAEVFLRAKNYQERKAQM